MRPSTKISIPQEYKDNEEKGLCRVCGKPKSEWESRRFTKHCTNDCQRKYQKCFLTWNSVRMDVLRKAKFKCAICKGAADEVDHKIAIVNGGDMWNKENLWALCHECHVKKTRKDLAYRVKPGQKRLTF